ncbi:MAG TPA: hypothetical protein VGR74_14195 [Actinomycetota bacterium]|nr:hypothetical protein [Actinomycetota bacterium]
MTETHLRDSQAGGEQAQAVPGRRRPGRLLTSPTATATCCCRRRCWR